MNDFTVQTKSPRPRGFIDNYAPQKKTLVLIQQIQGVLDEYWDHLPLTIRQVFYRLVGKNGYGKTEKDYNNLAEVIGKARRARYLPFDAFRDDGFTLADNVGWQNVETAKAAIMNTAENFRLDKQQCQERKVFAWCEAAGMLPQIKRIAEPFSVVVCSSGGFDSLTAKHDMAQRFAQNRKNIVLHVGDHDPSGAHVFGSLAADISAFSEAFGVEEITFRRIAVLPEHIEMYNLPTAPPKKTDRRTFEGDTVQVEALPPDVLAAIVQAEIESAINQNEFIAALKTEEEQRRELLAWLS